MEDLQRFCTKSINVDDLTLIHQFLAYVAPLRDGKGELYNANGGGGTKATKKNKVTEQLVVALTQATTRNRQLPPRFRHSRHPQKRIGLHVMSSRRS
jgi:hypothetical protein